MAGNRTLSLLYTSRSVFFYLQELQKWNSKINLIGNANEVVLIQTHFIDSLSCVLSSLIRPHIRLLDIGTGAGFPGIPLKIYESQLSLTAVDAVAKKIMFVRQICRSLGLQDATCVASRIEHTSCNASVVPNERSIPHQTIEIGCFDVVVSRAVGAIPYLLRLAQPFLAPDGHILLQRGYHDGHDLTSHTPEFQKLGLQLLNRVKINFSFFEHPRYLLIFHTK